MISLGGLEFSDPQGDKGIFAVLARMGASVTEEDGFIVVAGPDRSTV